MTEVTGSCLCGYVSYKGDVDVKMVINCHCKDAVEMSGAVSEYSHPADSGNTLTKMFCGKCGSQVAGKNTGRSGVLGLRAGCLDQKDLVQPGANIYCDSAINSTAMDSELKQFSGMPS